MNLFQRKTTWTNAEFIPLKLCIATAYLFLGARFADFFSRYNTLILLVFGVTVMWSMYLWISKMRREGQK